MNSGDADWSQYVHCASNTRRSWFTKSYNGDDGVGQSYRQVTGQWLCDAV